MGGVAVPLKTLERLSRIADPDDWAREVRQMIGNAMPTVAHNRILCAVYIGHENISEIKTPKGVIIPILKTPDAIKEDIWQGKMSLVLAVGWSANQDDPRTGYFWPEQHRIKPGDWVSFEMHHCRQYEVNHVPCREVDDHRITTIWRDPRHITS